MVYSDELTSVVELSVFCWMTATADVLGISKLQDHVCVAPLPSRIERAGTLLTVIAVLLGAARHGSRRRPGWWPRCLGTRCASAEGQHAGMYGPWTGR